MELAVKSFYDLTLDELYEILRLRAEVFVVEQDCVYSDLDGRDQASLHVFLRDGDGIQAYLRVLPAGTAFDTPGIGRVVTRLRRRGLGRQILAAGIRAAEEHFHARAITLEAQVYARGLYDQAGFRQTSGEFLEDGIPHIQMRLDLPGGRSEQP